MNPIAIVANIRFQDVLDILFLTLVAYHLYLWFQGTKAFKALVGLLVLGVVYTLARSWGLFLTTWVFQVLWQVLVVMLIILFHGEIRQVLERVNPLKILGFRRFSRTEAWIQDLVEGVATMAKRRIGALLIIEREDRVEEWITGGVQLEADPGPQLLVSLFQKESPLHDGALLIRNGRVSKVACYLPLSSAEGLPEEWGTRHRAALGISERCDALVVVISEERGQVSVVDRSEVKTVANPRELAPLIVESTRPPRPETTSWQGTVRLLLTRRWQLKAGTFAFVTVLWLLLAGQQDFEVSLRVPVKIKNVPAGLEIVAPQKPEIEIRVRGLRKDASTLNEKSVMAELDVSLAGLGRRTFSLSRDQIVLPSDTISIVAIHPPQLVLAFENKE